MSAQDSLLFVDTNIFLDFYRAMKSADFRLLGRLESIHDRIITSGQVEMEFQKNRQKLMLASFQKLVLKERPEIPGLFLNTPKGEKLSAALVQVEQSLKVLKESLSGAMKNPKANDPVYKAANDVFAFESEFNLNRAKQERYRIRRLARRRFVLGYPPRKDRDTSIGDAVNWEWIVECAKKSERSVIIVSRDGDYGLQFAGESYLNEWLRQEFSERVGRKSHVTLTESLSSALKQIKVHVTPAEEEAEKNLIQTGSEQYLWALYADAARSDAGKNLDELYKSLTEQIRLMTEGPAKRAAELLEAHPPNPDQPKVPKPPVDPKN